MDTIRQLSVTSCLALVLMLEAPAGEQGLNAAVLGPSRLEFAIVRDGENVGRHVIDFSRDGNSTNVRISTNVVVKVAFITVYRFEHQGLETWRGDQLVALRSQTNDDGTAHHVAVATEGDHLRVASDNNPAIAAASILPASLWNARVIYQSSLLNTLDGSQMRVAVEDKGEETVRAHGVPVSAHHFSISGGLNRDIWFDRSNTLVREQFAAKDGSNIVYELR